MVGSELRDEIIGTETEKQVISNYGCSGRDDGQNSPCVYRGKMTGLHSFLPISVLGDTYIKS